MFFLGGDFGKAFFSPFAFENAPIARIGLCHPDLAAAVLHGAGARSWRPPGALRRFRWFFGVQNHEGKPGKSPKSMANPPKSRRPMENQQGQLDRPGQSWADFDPMIPGDQGVAKGCFF